jgi:hypothetical protein
MGHHNTYTESSQTNLAKVEQVRMRCLSGRCQQRKHCIKGDAISGEAIVRSVRKRSPLG